MIFTLFMGSEETSYVVTSTKTCLQNATCGMAQSKKTGEMVEFDIRFQNNQPTEMFLEFQERKKTIHRFIFK